MNEVKLESRFDELRNDIKGLNNKMKKQNKKWEEIDVN